MAPGDSAVAEALSGSEAEAAPLGTLEEYADAAGAGRYPPRHVIDPRIEPSSLELIGML